MDFTPRSPPPSPKVGFQADASGFQVDSNATQRLRSPSSQLRRLRPQVRTETKYLKTALQNARRHRERKNLSLVIGVLTVIGLAAVFLPAIFQKTPPNLFQLPETLEIVAEDDESLLFNHPLSYHRVVNFQQTPRRDLHSLPVISLGTLVGNATDDVTGVADWVYPSLLRSSLRPWHWTIVVACCQQSKTGIATLQAIADRDARVKVITQRKAQPASVAMNGLLTAMQKVDAPFATFVDPYTIFEPTILEKSVWSLHAVTAWDMVDHFHVNFDVATGQGITSKKGLHSGAANLKNQLIPRSTVFRSTATAACQFANVERSDVALWLFWLCMADQDRWGGVSFFWRNVPNAGLNSQTLPEIGTWQRAPTLTPPTALLLSQLSSSFYPRLARYEFPKHLPARSVHLETLGWSAPYHNGAVSISTKRIMLVQGWLLIGGSELGFVKVLEHLAREGYAVTMVFTRFRYPEGVALRPEVAKYTNDIHFLPAFLRMSEFPSYIKHLIDTRDIPLVIMSNSQLIYQILPALYEQTPNTKYVDYLHNEGYDGWKNFGFPTFSLISQRYLARTLTCSAYLRTWLIEHGYPQNRVGVAKLGIDMANFPPTTPELRTSLKSRVLDANSDEVIITWLARLEIQKRPMMLPQVFYQAKKLVAERCGPLKMTGLIMGDGLLRNALVNSIAYYNLTDDVRLLGTVSRPEIVLQASDIFFLPTSMEGLSLALAEAMATGLAVLTSLVGAVPEQFTAGAKSKAPTGVLLQLTGNEDEEVSLYAEHLADLVCDPNMRNKLGSAAAKHVRQTFDTKITMPAFVKQLTIASDAKPAPIESTPNPAAYYGLEGMLNEDFRYVEMIATQSELASSLDSELGLPSLIRQCLQSAEQAQEDPAFMHWATSVVEPQKCQNATDDPAASSKWLLKSALHQCESWCIWDLRTFKEQGWRWNGSCFQYFVKGDFWHNVCRNWLHERPAITLLEA